MSEPRAERGFVISQRPEIAIKIQLEIAWATAENDWRIMISETERSADLEEEEDDSAPFAVHEGRMRVPGTRTGWGSAKTQRGRVGRRRMRRWMCRA